MSQIEREKPARTGTIRDEEGNVLFRYETKPSQWQLTNPLKKPDLLVADASGSNLVTIRRVSFLPSVFDLLDNDETVGSIKRIGVLRNRYAIQIKDAGQWTFHIPLFTITFHGESASTDIWVVVGPSERDWNILLRPGINPRPLLAALAFIHCERYYSS